MKKASKIAGALIFCLIISLGCATKEAVKNVPEEDVLRELAETYWGYRIKGEYDKSYAHEDSFTRRTLPLAKYIQLNSNPLLIFTKYEIIDIKRNSEDLFDVRAKIRAVAKVPGAKAFERDILQTEQWIKEDGNWHHVLRANNKLTR